VNQFYTRLRQLRFGPSGELSLDHIPRDQHRPHPPAARTPDIGRLEPLRGSHQPDDRAMLAVITKRADDRFGLDPHPRGWK
jgi:hypothetical protein